MTASAYTRLEERFRRVAALGEAGAVLNWDRAAMMPPGGAPARAEQLAHLSAVRHGILARPEVGDLIEAAAGDETLDPWRRANVAEMRRAWIHASALSEDLVMALARATNACEAVWREARARADFAAVLPGLKDVLALTREAAAAKAQRLGVSPYDALLDEYEPGGRSHDVDRVFAELEESLPPLMAAALDRQASRRPPLALEGTFPARFQHELATKMMAAFGFDFAHGRLDVSQHPFCGGVPDDVRVTTRYDEGDFLSGLMGVLHETGHALYESGLPAAWRGQPVGEARGMALHESQALLIEMQVCRSQDFLAFAAPMVREVFGYAGPAWTPANFYALSARVRPGFIRVDADEVTYSLHAILRYRLERAMLAGDLALVDLPGAWNDGMRELLGIVPPDDALGCLQDIHWPDGGWGYFPTYTLGALAAAQLFAAACRAVPGLLDGIGRGDFAPLLGWLRANVHARGSVAGTDEILTAATGAPLGVAAFKAHLESRYLPA